MSKLKRIYVTKTLTQMKCKLSFPANRRDKLQQLKELHTTFHSSESVFPHLRSCLDHLQLCKIEVDSYRQFTLEDFETHRFQMSSPKLPTQQKLEPGRSSESIPRILCIFHAQIIISLDIRHISIDEQALMTCRFDQQLKHLMKDEHLFKKLIHE